MGMNTNQYVIQGTIGPVQVFHGVAWPPAVNVIGVDGRRMRDDEYAVAYYGDRVDVTFHEATTVPCNVFIYD